MTTLEQARKRFKEFRRDAICEQKRRAHTLWSKYELDILRAAERGDRDVRVTSSSWWFLYELGEIARAEGFEAVSRDCGEELTISGWGKLAKDETVEPTTFGVELL